MLAQDWLNMKDLKLLLIMSLIIVAVVVLSVCADGLVLGCAHLCCTRAEPSRSLVRLARRLKFVRLLALDLLLLVAGGFSRGLFAVAASLDPTRAQLKVTTLRI